MRRILSGSATRAEVYALFLAAVLLLGGSVGAAVVITNEAELPGSEDASTAAVSPQPPQSESTEATPAASTSTTSLNLAGEATPVPTTASLAGTVKRSIPLGTEAPPATAAPRNPDDYCLAPELVGSPIAAWNTGQTLDGLVRYLEVSINARMGCASRVGLVITVCQAPELWPQEARIISQQPAAMTWIDRRNGEISMAIKWGPGLEEIADCQTRTGRAWGSVDVQ